VLLSKQAVEGGHQNAGHPDIPLPTGASGKLGNDPQTRFFG
jgi:hypothetical protein